MRRSGLLAVALALLAGPSCSHSPVWQRADFPTAPGETVAAVLPGRPWAAVGSLETKDGPQPRWWTSADGRHWRRAPMAFGPISEDGRHSRLVSIARTGSTTAALGYAVSAIHGNRRPTLWVLDHGALRETYLERELFGGPRILSIGRMSAGPRGFLVSGTRTGATGRQTAQVWWATSPPDWHRVDDQPFLASNDHEQVWGNDVASSPTRDVMVGRGDEFGNGGVNPTDIAAWYSDDGRHWTRAIDSSDVQPGRQELDRVVWNGHVFFAVGSDHDKLTLWDSTDGADWRVAWQFDAIPAGPETALDVSASGTVAAVVDGKVVVSAFGGRRVAAPDTGHRPTAVSLAAEGNDHELLAVTTDHGVEVFSRRLRR